MNHKKRILTATILLTAAAANAQTSVATAGGEVGSVSYTIGQLFVTPAESNNGSITPGVQQAFEITVVGVADIAADIALEAYPNPVADRLTLRVAEAQSSALRYTLTDANGRTIAADNITNAQTGIEMGNLVPAVYFLRIDDSDTAVKTFKIVKN